MFKFFKKDPIDRAKKHVEKALEEWEEDYPDYASVEYEKAAELFLEAERMDFAVKYFRESAIAALEMDNHVRAAEMKLKAARALVLDTRYDEAGSLYSEASDHYFREKQLKSSIRAISLAVLCHLGSRNFDTAINLFKKSEKRVSTQRGFKDRAHELANASVKILCEGEQIDKAELDKIIGRFKASESEKPIVEFVAASLRLALETAVVLEFAGKPLSTALAKTPIELELKYKCPAPVRVVERKFNISNSLSIINEPTFAHVPSTDGSWLITVKPVLSGEGVFGPIRLTLEGERVLVNKYSNVLKFEIAPAPAELSMNLSPRQIICGLDDEVVFDITIKNSGDGPANNLIVDVELSEGLELTMGSHSKSIQFLGVGEEMRFQAYVKGIYRGDELITLKMRSAIGGEEITQSARVKVD